MLMSENGEQVKLLRLNEAAKRLTVSVRSLYRLIDAGELAVVRIGGCVRVAESDLGIYIAEHREGGKV